ncbi:MAG: ATP-binding protein [Egibacteraceae bacterium]
MQPLLDRRGELVALGSAWESAGLGMPQLVVVWGRRRVGKTFLMLHMLDRLPRDALRVYHAATQQAERVELARFAESVERDLGSDVAESAGGGFASWEAALRFLAALGRQRPLAVVLDEVTYLTGSTPGFASIVQAVWDRESAAGASNLMLVLTGSVGTIERMVGGQGALHRRPTLELRLDPVDLPAAAEFLPGLGPDGLVEAYAACGGYPLHLLAWDAGTGAEENLLRLAGSAGGLLLTDARGMLQEELPDSGGYQRILAAVGRGRTRHGEIRTEADQRIEQPLDALVRVRLVRRLTPVGALRRATPHYEIADPYLRFWFAVLYADAQLVEAGQGRAVLRRSSSAWQGHLGWAFEEAARAHCQRLVTRGVLPDDLVVGRWWTSSGPPCEVDVLGLQRNQTALLGEAKWTAAPLGHRQLEKLRRTLASVPDPVEDPWLALWGRAGWDPAARAPKVLGYCAADVVTP